MFRVGSEDREVIIYDDKEKLRKQPSQIDSTNQAEFCLGNR